MKLRNTLALTSLTLVTALALTGCTQPEPKRSPTPEPSVTETETAPTETAPTAPPERETVPLPEDSSSAVQAASKEFSEYSKANFEFIAHPEVKPDYMAAYVVPGSPAEKIITDTYDAKIDQKLSQEGKPTEWTLNAGMSYAGALTDASTDTLISEFGSVYLYGCISNSDTVFLANGVEDADVPKGSFPYSVEMIYLPDEENWFVSNVASLEGQEGAPLC